MRTVLVTTLLALIVLPTAVGATPAPGTPDLGFGDQGRVRGVVVQGGPRWAYTGALAAHRGGILVQAGWAAGFGYADHVWRYTADGRRDRLFGAVDGRLGAVLPGGRIVVVRDDSRTIRRFDAHGRIERTYGTRGDVHLAVGSCAYEPGAVAAGRDGSVLVAVTSCHSDSTDDTKQWHLMRVLPSGRVDRSFGSRGLATFPLAKAARRPNALIVTADGGVLAAGEFRVSRSGLVTNTGIVRFRRNGRVDTSFGAKGLAMVAGAERVANPASLFLSHGGIVVAGCNDFDPGVLGLPVVVARFTTRGAFTGAQTFDYGHSLDFDCSHVFPAAGGKLLVVGTVLARLLADGRPDPAFGANGSTVLPQGGEYDRALALPDRSIVVGGDTNLPGQRHAIQLARFHG